MFTNSESVGITISKYITSAPGFAVSGLRLPVSLAAGQSIKFNLVFTPLDGRTINGDIVFYSNASNSVLSINVNGRGLTCGTLAGNPGAISFGLVQVGTSLTKSETLTNSGNCNITLSEINVSGNNFSRVGPTLPLMLAPGKSVTFSIKFAPNSTGQTYGCISVISSAVDSKLALHLSGTGTGAGALSISPAAMTFGVVGMSESQTATLVARASATILQAVKTGC